MEVWFFIIVTLCLSALVKSLFDLLLPSSINRNRNRNRNLPPGPTTVPIIGNFLWLGKSLFDIEFIIRDLKSKYGPIITLKIGSRPAIFVSSHSLAHKALVQNGGVFSDRPTPPPAGKIFNSNQRNVSSAPYGPTWRLLRRNLTSEILHPSRVKSYSGARRWVLGILIQRLLVGHSQSPELGVVNVMEHLQYAMFCLLALMCFGDKLDEDRIKDIENVQRTLLVRFSRFNVLNFWPRLTKILFRHLWREVLQLRQDQENVLIPLIKSRIESKSKAEDSDSKDDKVVAYVDTLVDLQLPDEKRKLNYQEMVTLCGEFLNAGTDTTSTALQWILANLVKNPDIQDKLYQEIIGVVGPSSPPLSVNNDKYTKEFVNEEDLQRMPYLKAVVLEGLRRHPPGHFVLPHAVSEQVELDGYVIPKNATVNFTVADMGWDPKVWENPMEFKPERFLTKSNGEDDGVFDITGSKEIKMMPFGVGRRICPASSLALLHLEFFIANLVWYFEWKAVDGYGVDLSEKQEFTIVMKNPLQAHILPRNKAA